MKKNGFTSGEVFPKASTDFRMFAFTLAEVLITLGIIGVVAALTLPTLIQHHRKTTIETSLSKFYSTMNQAIQRAEVDSGDKVGWDLPDIDTFWEKYLKPYLQYSEVEDTKTQSGNDAKIVYLSDGSAVRIDIYNTRNSDGTIKERTSGGHFLFAPSAKTFKNNVNVDNSIIGTKIFYFGFWPNANAPESTDPNDTQFKYHKNKGVEPYKVHWDGNEESLYSDENYGCSSSSKVPHFCTALIQHNGWKIPEDYPFKL